MKKWYPGLLCLLLLFCFFSPDSVRAGELPFELSIFAAGFFSDDDDMGNNGGGGARFTYFFADRVGVEGGVSIIPVTAQVFIDGPIITTFDVDAFSYNGNAVFHILTGRVVPFVVGGVGGTTFSRNSTISAPGGIATASDSETNFTLNYGGGLKIAIAKNIGVRADIRGYRIFSDSVDINMLETGGGISFYF